MPQLAHRAVTRNSWADAGPPGIWDSLTKAKPIAQPDWTDHYWWSGDGVRLHARLYGDARADGALPLLCLPGLMRNARDFEVLAPMLAGHGPVAAVDFRGRGDSGFAKDPMSYVPLTYVQDMVALLADLGWERFAVVGTSLGGIVAMLLAAAFPGRVAGAVLNDVGPELNPAGLERIRTSIGASGSQPTWLHAARQAAQVLGDIYPDYDVHDWLRFVHRTQRLTPQGRVVPDYDKQIAVPLRVPAGEGAADLWPVYAALADVPLLIVRGERSDILPAAAAQKMLARAHQAELVQIARTGHAPTLDEDAARSAIARWRTRLTA
jgi:pimeloyl-ACP methyl ester carboxylesterase